MQLIVGIDEVGRGCWAGPLVAAAVLLIQPIEGLNDSKLLTKKQRTELAVMIKQSSYYGIGWVQPPQLDSWGLTKATSQAMTQALSQIPMPYDEIIIDGNYNYIQGSTSRLSRIKTLIRADQLVPAVSAASILAKVERDEYMATQALLFPGYGFEKHVGYGTARHLAALKQLGLCDIHRKSYKPVQAFLL